MDEDCGITDVSCHAANAANDLLNQFADMISWMQWTMVRSAFTGNAGTIDGTEWGVAFSMTSKWAMVLLIVVVALTFVQMAGALIRANIQGVLDAFLRGVLAWPATLAAVWLAVQLTSATDLLTVGILNGGASSGTGVLGAFFDRIDELPLQSAESQTVNMSMALAVLMILSFLASIALSFMLAFRNFALICLVGFSPIAFMAMPLQATRGWSMKWLQAVIALILAKPIAAGMLVLANDLTVQSTDMWQWLVGVVAMAMASFAPVITMRMFSFMGGETAASYGSHGSAIVSNTGAGFARAGRSAMSLAA